MTSMLEGLREIIGTPDFYITGVTGSNSWDYGAMIEYLVCALILMIVVSSIFRLLGKAISK